MTALRSAPALLLAALLAPALASGAEVIALLPATGANVDAGTLEAARDVFRSHLERTGREVRLAAAPDPRAEATPQEAAAAARAAGASRAAVLRLSALGATTRARLTVYDLSGRTLHTDDMAAGSPGDLDPALQRLAQGYASGAGAARSAEIDTVTDREARPLNREQATRNFGLRLGGITPLHPGGDTGTGGGVFWQYDSRSFLVDVSVDLFFGTDYHDTAVGFGAYLPLSRGNLAPYLGAGLKYAWTRFEGSHNSGLQPHLVAGGILGRLSSVQLRAEAAWFQDLFTTNGKKANGLLWTVGVAY